MIVDDGPVVDGNAIGAVNVAYVSVKVCAPGGASACVTVDHVMVDTGSSGLRLLASALGTGLSLPAATAGNGQALAECVRFAVGYSWGAVRRADVHLGGESALDIPVQVISDATLGTPPADCGSSGTPMNDAPSLLANGILGIGHAVADCNRVSCGSANDRTTYYTCTAQSCTGLALPASKQVSNPVAAFAVDNNGSVLRLPAIDAKGAVNVAGTLTFGIGTQSNNALGSTTIQRLDPENYTFATIFDGRSHVGFIDSGSTFTTFTDHAIAECIDFSGFYCPDTTLDLKATNIGADGTSVEVQFSIANVETLASESPDATAVNDVAAISPGGTTVNDDTFDWGLSFFYGRSVFTAIEGRMAAGTVGPWVGYQAIAQPSMTIAPVSVAASGARL